MTHTRRHPAARALTLIEVIVSIPLVGILLVSSLSTLGMSRLTSSRVADGRRGLALAQGLMAEILRLDYIDPDGGAATSLGTEAGELVDGVNRSLWDDIDDANAWSASPPRKRDGTQIDGLAGWTRTVEVVWVDPWQPGKIVGSDQGAKRIIVRVVRDGVTVISLTALRTDLE